LGGIEKNVNSYLEEVGVDSEEHKKYLEKLNKVLEEMKGSSNSAERKNYFSFKETVDAFDHYLSEKKIKLTAHEKDRFAVIAGSGLNNLAKKRMAEDLIHQVKDRVAGELEFKAESGKKQEDIARLKKTGFWFTDWYRLTKFALDFGTITLLSHRYRSESFDVIRLRAASAHKEILADLKKILDGYYYYLTVLEYNSIVKLYEMGKAFEKLAAVKRNLSYHPMELFEQMNDFSSVYISVMRNQKSIDNGLKKVFKDNQPGHGFMGYVGFITDRQVHNSRTVKYSEREIITKTISGALYSYYTAYIGVRVKTFNQLMYIVNEEGELNSSEKKYTPEAAKAIESESHEQATEGSKIKSRLSELSNVTTKYSIQGKNLAKRLFEIEARGALSAWNKDSQIKPFFMLMKVFDAYLKYILELVITRDNFELEYDNNIIKGYFDNFPELSRAVDDYRSLSLELQGKRGKDLQNFKHSQETDKDEFIKKLMEHENPATLPGETKHLRESLSEISAKCYNICMRFNDLINKFYQAGKYESREVKENYNFLLNAKIIHPKVRSFEYVLNRKEVYLVDLLEAGCSIAEYFAETLKHNGIKAISDEVFKLQGELESYNIQNIGRNEMSDNSENSCGEDGLNSDTEKIYNDTLTGFKKWEYFEDFILHEVYDENGNYSEDRLRHVFCAELSNLVDVNRVCGNSSGDMVYKRFSEIVKEILSSAGSENIVMRSKGGLIIGYINDVTAVESVDFLFKMLNLVKEYSLDSGIDSLPELIFNAGLYTEKKGTNALKNIEIARSIMFHASDGRSGHVGFMRNSDLVVSDKDFDRRGRLREELISVLS
jgi:GGDEF domain-containing protein